MSEYGCHNKPRPEYGAPLIVQAGWYSQPHTDGTWTREARWISKPFAMSTDCQYTRQHASDPLCGGCVHRAKVGEQKA